VEEMGILDRLKSAFGEQEQPDLVEELVAISGRYEALAARLKRHASMCKYPGIAAGVAAIGEKEAAHERELRKLVMNRGRWPLPPSNLPHEGSSNWERFSLDLEMLLALSQDLNRLGIEWGTEDSQMGDLLGRIAREAGDNEIELRRLAAKCDPQAID
jgi:hypothetical protein